MSVSVVDAFCFSYPLINAILHLVCAPFVLELTRLGISEDLDEIRALSDRILVMYEGKIVGEVENKDVDIEHLGMLMTGGG